MTKSRLIPFVAYSFILLYIINFAWLGLIRYWSYGAAAFDLGVYDQVAWNTMQGRFLFYTALGYPSSHFAHHASPIMALVAPFYLIHPHPETLLILQATIVGLGGLPLFWLAQEKLHSNFAALSLLLAYLFFPTLQGVLLFDFHPPALAVGFLMAAFYCLETKRHGWFLVWVILTLACKEHLSLVIIFLGLYAALYQREWQLGATTIFMGAAWFIVVMYQIIPAHSVRGEHVFLNYYAEFGNTPTEIIINTSTRPDLVLTKLLQPTQRDYLWRAFSPFAFLSILGLPQLLIATPMFAINLLSSRELMQNANSWYYGADIVPWVSWAALFGLIRFQAIAQWLDVKFRPHRFLKPVRSDEPIRSDDKPHGSLYLGTWLLLLMMWGAQLFYGHSIFSFQPTYWQITAHNDLASRFIAQIPTDAPISAHTNLYPHVSNRQFIYQFPTINEAEYVWLDVSNNNDYVLPAMQLKSSFDNTLTNGFGILDAADGYILLQRGLTQTTLPLEFYTFIQTTNPKPQYPLTVEFSHTLRLIGYDKLAHRYPPEISLRLYWQTSQPISATIYPFITSTPNETMPIALPYQQWYPLNQWQPNQTIMMNTIPITTSELNVGVLLGQDWQNKNQRLKITQAEGTLQNDTWVTLPLADK